MTNRQERRKAKRNPAMTEAEVQSASEAAADALIQDLKDSGLYEEAVAAEFAENPEPAK